MKILLALIVALAAMPVSAATYCIPSGDVAAFGQALLDAQANGEDDLIHLQSGEFDLTADLLHASAESHALSIEGGYYGFFGDPCGLAPVAPDASKTILNGGHAFRFSAQLADGTLLIRGLTMADMATGIGAMSSAVDLEGKDIVVANSIFSGNVSLDAEGVLVRGQGAIQLQNSLFYSNASFGGRAAVGVENLIAGAAICNLVVNTTIADNVSSLAALSLSNTDTACPSIVANSAFWGNGTNDLIISTETYLVRDDIRYIHVVAGPVHPDGTVPADPLFRDPSGGDYSLRDESPLRDAGDPGGFVWLPGDWDVVGNARAYNGTPDIGAFEVQDVIFANGCD